MAALEARRQAARRRVVLGIGGVIAVLALALVVFLVTRSDGKTNVATEKSTTIPDEATPTTAAVASAAGKPCVALADALPAGAPTVPVKVGPPPAQLITEDLKPGTGAVVAKGATVTAHYIGVSCSTGKIFDSSYSRGAPTPFSLAQVIKGWQDGIPGMKVGGQRLLGIPSDQAYGAAGRPPSIAPDEALWFVVEVTDTKAG
jgi:peptidylprolyl isomerase